MRTTPGITFSKGIFFTVDSPVKHANKDVSPKWIIPMSKINRQDFKSGLAGDISALSFQLHQIGYPGWRIMALLLYHYYSPLFLKNEHRI